MAEWTAEVTAWWKSLTQSDRSRVMAWLRENRPPAGWVGGSIAYAYTEMFNAPDRRA